MYNPKDVLTDNGYDDYKMHLKNIENALFYLENHADDLHIGYQPPFDVFWRIVTDWKDLKHVLKTGDGEKDNE